MPTDAAFLKRFLAKVAAPDASGCLRWTGAKTDGYGQIQFNGRLTFAHRIAYELKRGPIPAGLTIDHLCRVRACVNPDHMEAVTTRVNTLRSPTAVTAVNSRKTHCRRGHPYTPENTWLRVRNDGHGKTERWCRECMRINSTKWNHIYAERNKAAK